VKREYRKPSLSSDGVVTAAAEKTLGVLAIKTAGVWCASQMFGSVNYRRLYRAQAKLRTVRNLSKVASRFLKFDAPSINRTNIKQTRYYV
jgi:hypothetical protein